MYVNMCTRNSCSRGRDAGSGAHEHRPVAWSKGRVDCPQRTHPTHLPPHPLALSCDRLHVCTRRGFRGCNILDVAPSPPRSQHQPRYVDNFTPARANMESAPLYARAKLDSLRADAPHHRPFGVGDVRADRGKLRGNLKRQEPNLAVRFPSSSEIGLVGLSETEHLANGGVVPP
jgi:hypothetical protein